MPALCRDCDALPPEAAKTCLACGSARLIRHPELLTLTIGHIDCDAFYASVEKRDRPELADKPVIVGGGTRGVVTTCCYIARLYGVRSAMPMFKALALCPQAVVIRPNMDKYVTVSHEIRALMEELTPLVQPLSIDEAVLDLAGTQALHNAAPAITLSRFSRKVEQNIGVTVSIGISHNRLLAKLAAERGKPRGFSIFGQEAPALLAPEPVGTLPGIGPAMVKKFFGLGITTIGQLAAMDDRTARRQLGLDGPALTARARGEDARTVHTERDTKSISAETTFSSDLASLADLEPILWRLSEKLCTRLREQNFAAAGITLKLKTAAFASRTRAQRLANPTQLPETIFEAALTLLRLEADGTKFRLLGIGTAALADPNLADQGDLADTTTPRRAARQTAILTLREKFGNHAISSGRALPKTPPTK
jgi:DNA polymerase-4